MIIGARSSWAKAAASSGVLRFFIRSWYSVYERVFVFIDSVVFGAGEDKLTRYPIARLPDFMQNPKQLNPSLEVSDDELLPILAPRLAHVVCEIGTI